MVGCLAALFSSFFICENSHWQLGNISWFCWSSSESLFLLSLVFCVLFFFECCREFFMVSTLFTNLHRVCSLLQLSLCFFVLVFAWSEFWLIFEQDLHCMALRHRWSLLSLCWMCSLTTSAVISLCFCFWLDTFLASMGVGMKWCLSMKRTRGYYSNGEWM